MSLIGAFVQGGFNGSIADDFIEILLAMLVFTFINSKLAMRLWRNSRGHKIDFQKIVNYTAIIFPSVFLAYALFGINLGIPCLKVAGYCFLDYNGGALLLHGLNYDLLARVFGKPNSGHVAVWIFILGFYYFVMFLERHGEYFAGKALISTLGMIALSEFHWNLYYGIYLEFVSRTFVTQVLGGFVLSQLWLLTVIFIWYFYYRKFFLKMLAIVLPVTTTYFLAWFADGFPITLTSNATMNPQIYTIWYLNLLVNGIEIGSWAVISLICCFAYWAVKTGFFGKLEKKLGTNLAEKVAVAWAS